MFKNMGLTSLRLTFGGSPCPNEFCIASELCSDLANDILHCQEWDPKVISSPHADKLQDPILLDQQIPFVQAKDLDVDIPNDNWGRVDNFIDDGIVIVPDLKDNRNRAIQAMLLAIHILFRPGDKNEKILREDCLSLGKLAEEGFLSETPTILGWVINTRLLTMSLPYKKFKYWNQDLIEVIKTRKISFKDLEKILGRLNHAAMGCPLMRYFLSRLRKVLLLWQNSNSTKKVKRYLSSQVIEDLKLWQRIFLPKIYRGISLNLISYRRPLVISWADACPKGMGGYDLLGNAWQYKLSEDDRIACTYQNNSLEFVAVLISVWVSIANNTAKSETCFLALSDNSSAMGWLHKASIDDTK
jgi:hypothetical protein